MDAAAFHGAPAPALLAGLAGLELRARTLVDGWLAGPHRSPQMGFSLEFAEHREYSPGDDLRYLDWKVFGKTDRYQLKQFEAETNLACMLLVDASESMTYRSQAAPWSKLECAVTAAAALASVVLRQNDAVGCLAFGAGPESLLRPSAQGGQWGALLRILERAQVQDTPLSPPGHSPFRSIARAVERIPARSVVALFSDALGDQRELLTALNRLRHSRHDVILFQIVDPAEEDFPFEGLTLFEGLEETGQEALDARLLQEAYRAEFAAFCRSVMTGCRELGAQYERVRTDGPLDRILASFLTRRR